MVNYPKRMLSFVVMTLLLLAVLPSFVSAAGSSFKDVKMDHWAYSSIVWAYNEGIIKGYLDGTFAPDATLTEAQFVALLVRFDCSASDTLKTTADYYRYMQNNGMPLNGYTNTKLRN